MRAIDSEALIAKIMNEMRRYNYDETRILTLASVIKMVDELSTIDVVERKKGEWTETGKSAVNRILPSEMTLSDAGGADMR